MNRKALTLLSGGLDSTLAIKCILEQGIEIVAMNFVTPFCNCNRKDGCGNEARRVCSEFGIGLKVSSLVDEYFKIIRHPRHGYGANMNPCLDCRILMFKKAGEYMKEIGASFIITGEVLGQRPMSQRKRTMQEPISTIVERLGAG
jgi:tRNA U34 2-thiouridine synthase MnmA/TrmU